MVGKRILFMMSKHIFQKEPVLSIATCLAVISAFFVPPDAEYLGYIDFRTLAILFSLMTVMAGLRGQGVFDRLGHALLSHTRTTLQLTVVLVGLCFFSSMLITNDVSLLTFVPFTFVVLNSLNASVRSKLLLPIVCMQTIAANLGSMLTPLGNPQNLYLYGKSGMAMSSFVLLMLPYSIISLYRFLLRRTTFSFSTFCEVEHKKCPQRSSKDISIFIFFFSGRHSAASARFRGFFSYPAPSDDRGSGLGRVPQTAQAQCRRILFFPANCKSADIPLGKPQAGVGLRRGRFSPLPSPEPHPHPRAQAAGTAYPFCEKCVPAA